MGEGGSEGAFPAWIFKLLAKQGCFFNFAAPPEKILPMPMVIYCINSSKGVGKGRVLGLTPPLELDILQKLYYMREGD